MLYVCYSCAMQEEESVRKLALADGIAHFATGIAVSENSKLLVVRRVPKDDFLGGEWELPGPIKPEPNEYDAYRWITKSEVPSLQANEVMHDCLL
jgi:hypothetical protein